MELSENSPYINLDVASNTHASVEGVKEFELFVRRKGEEAWFAKYVNLSFDGTSVEFMLDGLLFSRKAGIYEARLYQNNFDGTCCECFTFFIKHSKTCAVKPKVVLPEVECNVVIHKELPEGLDEMAAKELFGELVDFEATLCGAMSKTDTVLPLVSGDIAKLCDVILCRSVELSIDDGCRQEIITFRGCQAGVPVIDRCANEEPPMSFPAGSKLTFSWTANNVQAVCEGCE